MKIGVSEIILVILIAFLFLRPYLERWARRFSRRFSANMERQFHTLEKISEEAWKALKTLCIGVLIFLLLLLFAISRALTH